MGSNSSKEQNSAESERETNTQSERDIKETHEEASEQNEKEDGHDDGFEIIDKDDHLDGFLPKTVEPPNSTSKNTGIWIGIDLGTSNCACAVWDSTRGRPKWIRLKDFAIPQGGKAGRIVPSTVQIQNTNGVEENKSKETGGILELSLELIQEIDKWNHQKQATKVSSSPHSLQSFVGHHALVKLQEDVLQELKKTNASSIITSMKRVLGVCDTTKLDDLESDFRRSLPFSLEETKDGTWVVPVHFPSNGNAKDSDEILYVRPIHVAAILLQAIRNGTEKYLQREITRKRMIVPGADNRSESNHPLVINAVIGVPAYFGQAHRHMVEEAGKLAGFTGRVSTLTESTAAAMAYGLFVGGGASNDDAQSGSKEKTILVLDMGGGTTDITIAQMNTPKDTVDEDPGEAVTPQQQFKVILTEGDNRLGGEDMDQALFDHVVRKATDSPDPLELTSRERQSLLHSCQQAKEALCGDLEHGELPAESFTVKVVANSFPDSPRVDLQEGDLNTAIMPLLERTASLVEKSLKRYQHKLSLKSNVKDTIHEVILIGGATRVPALRRMLKDRFFSHLELCTSVNAMSAVAKGTAIQAAILSRQVPLHEVRSAMMLDTTPHAIGVLLPSNNSSHERHFVEILPRDTPLPAQGYATFYVGDLNQRGVTVAAVEFIPDVSTNDNQNKYQPLGEFTFLLHRLSPTQKIGIQEDEDHPGLRPVDIGMALGTDGSFQVSIYDKNDPDHIRKKDFYQKTKKQNTNHENAEARFLLDFVVGATVEWKDEGMTGEEFKLLMAVSMLFVFYLFVKLFLSTENVFAEEEMSRIL